MKQWTPDRWYDEPVIDKRLYGGAKVMWDSTPEQRERDAAITAAQLVRRAQDDEYVSLYYRAMRDGMTPADAHAHAMAEAYTHAPALDDESPSRGTCPERNSPGLYSQNGE